MGYCYDTMKMHIYLLCKYLLIYMLIYVKTWNCECAEYRPFLGIHDPVGKCMCYGEGCELCKTDS